MIKMKWIGWIGAGLLSAAMIPGVGLARTVRASHAGSSTTRVVQMRHATAKPQAAKRVVTRSTKSLRARSALKTSSKKHISAHKLTRTSHRAIKTSAKRTATHGKISSRNMISSRHTSYKLMAHRPVSKKG